MSNTRLPRFTIRYSAINVESVKQFSFSSDSLKVLHSRKFNIQHHTHRGYKMGHHFIQQATVLFPVTLTIEIRKVWFLHAKELLASDIKSSTGMFCKSSIKSPPIASNSQTFDIGGFYSNRYKYIISFLMILSFLIPF